LVAYEEELLNNCKTRRKRTEWSRDRSPTPGHWRPICCLRPRARLQAIHDGWDTKRAELDDALLYNRKLWAIFLTSVTTSEHPLPVEIRQNVANLGLFVMNQTVSMLQAPKPRSARRPHQHQSELASGLLGR